MGKQTMDCENAALNTFIATVPVWVCYSCVLLRPLKYFSRKIPNSLEKQLSIAFGKLCVQTACTSIQLCVFSLLPNTNLNVQCHYVDEILAKVKEAGFTIAMEKQIVLSEGQIADFYGQHTDKDWFGEFTKHMKSGPVLALALAREEAVEKWREMLGPRDVQQAKKEAPGS